MKIVKINPKKSLNKAFLKQRLSRTEIELFKSNLIKLLDEIDEIEREENQKNHIRDFLRDTYYKETNEINTKDTKDLVIHLGKTNKDKVGVIIEAKRPSNRNEMLSESKPNSKAFQELVLYYLRERIEENNIDIKYLIATNVYEWYIFDASYFEKLFFRNKSFVKHYEEWRDGKKVTKDTNLFYNDIAKTYIDSLDEEIPCTFFDIREYETILRNENKADDKTLIALQKLLSPFFLLRVPFANDSNSLNEKFYKELLHLIGLEEAKKGTKNIIRRKESDKQSGSLIENAINILITEDSLHKIKDKSIYGQTKDEQLFNVALELSLTWINRILFLKLLEGQLIAYHKGNKDYKFLNSLMIHDFDELYKLFHQVLARNIGERTASINQKYVRVPYLNSSLFEISELEDTTIKINSLDNSETVELINTTILKDDKKKNSKLPALEYLFKFLDAYDFSSEGGEDIAEDNKSIITASVLGKVFEKINGYKDGSIFTPGFITMYMSRQSLRLAVIQKFNEYFKSKKIEEVNSFEELYNRIDKLDIKIANDIINSLRICDPAVGSGHFLVSVLNEIIVIKSELGILIDKNGKRLRDYEVIVDNDELIISDDNGIFEYNFQNKESQRIQETIFNERQTIIENCLFGVDINPNSVKICRLRLWIELLKSSYYKAPDFTKLETLPNIDINIKCGNSLISRYTLDANLKKALQKSKWNITSYRLAVMTYRNAKSKDEKRAMESLIDEIKSNFETEIQLTDKRFKKLRDLKGELFTLTNQGVLFDKTKKEKQEWNTKVTELTADIKKQEELIEEIKNNVIYKDAFEWRFEFPEVLNNNGDFEGFDSIIGNPPYIKEYENHDAFNGLRNLECYQGKMDIWYLFGDLGLKLLKPDNYLCYIATNNWVTNAGASNFRNIVINKSQIVNLTDFGAYMIFENASIQTMIMLFKNNANVDNYTFDYRKLEGDKLILQDVLYLLEGTETEKSALLSPVISRANLTNKSLTFNTDENSDLLVSIKAKHNFIIDPKKEIAQGIVPNPDVINNNNILKLPVTRVKKENIKVGDGVFILDKGYFNKLSAKESKYIKPIYEPYLIDKYYINYYDKEIIYITKKNFKNDAPKLISHLEKFKEIMDDRRENQQGKLSFNHLHWPRNEYFFEKGEKILSVRKCAVPTFTYTEEEAYVMMSFNVIRSKRINLKYLTGLLNSQLIAFWLRKKGKMQGNAYQLDKEPLLEIPIYKPADKDANEIAKLVDQILLDKQKGENTNFYEQQIDQMIYKLYDLTKQEIKIIEGEK